jgi:hypothetical protein
MAQQTAVDWFYNAIQKNTLINLSTLYEQAKLMEKEQIEKARLDGFKISAEGWNGEYPFEICDDNNISQEIDNIKYYNETYNK